MQEIQLISLSQRIFSVVFVKIFRCFCKWKELGKCELENISWYTSGLIFQPFLHDITVRIKNSWFIFLKSTHINNIFSNERNFETFFFSSTKLRFAFQRKAWKIPLYMNWWKFNDATDQFVDFHENMSPSLIFLSHWLIATTFIVCTFPRLKIFF